MTAVCGTQNVEQTGSLGADHVIDYTRENILTSDQTYDIILAINGNYPLLACRRMLKANGKYVMIGGAIPQITKSLLFGWVLSFGSRKIRFIAAKPNQEDFTFIVNLVNEGSIKPVIDRQFQLNDTAEAFRYLAEGHARGKVMITINTSVS